MTLEAVLSISAMAVGVGAIIFSLRAYGASIKSAEPDPERVKRFVDSAPLDRLSNMKANAH